MRPLFLLLTLTAGLTAAGASCGGERDPLALGEPIRVRGAAFKEGALPGAPPAASDAPGPRVTAIESANNALRPGQTEKRLLGRTSPEAVAVGLRFADLGTGYWILGLDAPDPTANNEPTWEALCDLSEKTPPGLHRLLFAAIDDAGRAGPQREQRVCVLPPYPDNLNACDPKIEPPAAVLALAWDSNVDLDLVVETPGGKTLSAKRPTTAPLTEAGVPALPATAPGVGVLDRDANGGCVLDGLRREHVVWQSSPTPGTYYVRANLFDACGEGSVRFVVSLLLPEDRPDGAGRHLVEKLRIPGQLVALDANGGAGPGLFVTQFDFRLPEEVVPVIVEKLLKVALLGSSWVMYLLIGLSILSLSLMIERCLFFWRHRDDLDALEQRLHGSLHEEDFDQADRILAESRSLEARVLRRALRWAHGGADAFQEVVASELGKLRRELERGMTTLGTLGNNAPFIGLLGTVIGVIEAFHQLGDAGQNKGAMGNVMAGIAEALVATGIGLFVALPAVVAFNAFQKKIGDVEGTTEALAHLISAAIKTREAGVGRVVELTVDEEPEVVAPRVAQVEG